MNDERNDAAPLLEPLGVNVRLLEQTLTQLEQAQAEIRKTLREGEQRARRARAEPGPPEASGEGRRARRHWLGFSRNSVIRLLQRAGEVRRGLRYKVARKVSGGILIVATVGSGVMTVGGILKHLGIDVPLPPLKDLEPSELALATMLSLLLTIALATMTSEFRLFQALREESESVIQLNEMEERYAQKARDGIAYYSAILKNLRLPVRLGRRASSVGYYRTIAELALRAHRDALRQLAEGIWTAHESDVDEMLHAVLDSDATYAAVSHDDLSYWRSGRGEGNAYRRQLHTAARRGNVMRIFVVRLQDLRDSWDDYLDVLERQGASDVRWGIAIADRFDRSIPILWRSEVQPHLPLIRRDQFDFALVNGGEVATFFTMNPLTRTRHLLAAFHSSPRRRSVVACGSMLTRLVSEVWMCSESFARDWRKFLPAVYDDHLRNAMGKFGTSAGFVRKMDRGWKKSRTQRIIQNRELLHAMNVDADWALKLSEPNGRAPFEMVGYTRSLVKDMERFRELLKADVFATGEEREIEDLCGPAELARYHEAVAQVRKRPAPDSQPSTEPPTAPTPAAPPA